MSDHISSSEGMSSHGAAEGKLSAFLSTTRGKAMIGTVALVALILAAVAIWLFFLLASSAQNALKVRAASTTRRATQVAREASDTIIVTPPPQKSLSVTFTFRNIFEPTVAGQAESTSDSGDSGTSSDSGGSSSSDPTSTPDVSENTLYLQSTSTVDGEQTATFVWNGKTYTLQEGDTIAGTPWKVLEIHDNYVVMLYGDTKVTLSTGQGLTK